MKTCLVYHWNQNRNKAGNKCSLLQYRGIYLSVYLTTKPCLSLLKTAFLRMAIKLFGVLFCLLIKKFILGCDTIWQSMGKFLWGVGSVNTFPHMDKEEKFLSSKLHIGMVSNFYTFSLDLKIEELKNFWEKRYQLLPSPNDICTPFDS